MPMGGGVEVCAGLRWVEFNGESRVLIQRAFMNVKGKRHQSLSRGFLFTFSLGLQEERIDRVWLGFHTGLVSQIQHVR